VRPSKAPAQERETQFGVPQLIGGDALEYVAQLGVSRVLAGFGSLDRGDRFADAGFGDRTTYDVRKRELIERALQRQRARLDRAARVSAGQTEAQLGVRNLVAERSLGVLHERCRSSEGQKLECEAGKHRYGDSIQRKPFGRA
jgi:hypothetical protein